MHHVFIAGPCCFMQNQPAVAELLSPDRYTERWPIIPKHELLASCVNLQIGAGNEKNTQAKRKESVPLFRKPMWLRNRASVCRNSLQSEGRSAPIPKRGVERVVCVASGCIYV